MSIIQMITCPSCRGTGRLACECTACHNAHRAKCLPCKGEGEVSLDSLPKVGAMMSNADLLAAESSARNERTDRIAEELAASMRQNHPPLPAPHLKVIGMACARCAHDGHDVPATEACYVAKPIPVCHSCALLLEYDAAQQETEQRANAASRMPPPQERAGE